MYVSTHNYVNYVNNYAHALHPGGIVCVCVYSVCIMGVCIVCI